MAGPTPQCSLLLSLLQLAFWIVPIHITTLAFYQDQTSTLVHMRLLFNVPRRLDPAIKVGIVSESRAYLIYTTQFIYTGLATAVSLLGM